MSGYDRRSARWLAAWGGGGALLGTLAALLEWCANHGSGGLLPWPSLVDLGALYTAAGAFLGFVAGGARRFSPLAERCSASAMGVAVTVLAFSSLWVLSFLSPRRSLLFLVGAPVYFWVVCRWGVPREDGYRPLIALQRSILALVSMVFGSLALELLVDESGVRDLATLAGLLLLPIASVALHGACVKRLLDRGAAGPLSSATAVLLVSALVVSPSLWASRPAPFGPLRAPGVAAGLPAGPLPNILVISLDTTRADRLSVYGYERETTPRLSELAADSLVFSNCVSTSTWTLPSHASLFTGLHPRTHGATLAGSRRVDVDLESAPLLERDKVGLAYPLAPEHETLAEILSARGYATAAIVANHSYLYRYFGLAQGFQYYDDSPGMLLRRPPNATRLGKLVSRNFLRRKYRSARQITSEAIRWLDGVGSQPFLLFVNFMEPHAPLVISRGEELFSAARERESWRPWQLESVEYTRKPEAWSAREAEIYSAMYDDAIRAMDAEIGRLLADLRRRGAYEDLMVVVFGDHGELLGEHGLVGHIGRTPYEGLVKVPLLVKFPGGARRGRWEGRVQTLDVFPTLLGAVGIEPGREVQGEILPAVSHEIVVEQLVHAALAEVDPTAFDRETRAVYRGRYKLIATSRNELELYDVDADPTETTDLSAQKPDIVRELHAAMVDWEATTPFHARRGDEIPSEQVLERLRSLGYVE